MSRRGVPLPGTRRCSSCAWFGVMTLPRQGRRSQEKPFFVIFACPERSRRADESHAVSVEGGGGPREHRSPLGCRSPLRGRPSFLGVTWWRLLRWGVALLAGVLPLACTAVRRSVVLISLDTCRADRLGCYGHAPSVTPTLDSLAAAGAVFLDCYTTAPLTLPAHASLLTSQLPPKHGVRDNAFYYLDANIVTLAEVLAERGFETGAVVGGYPVSAQYGLSQGFDVYDDDLPLARPTGLELGYPERTAAAVTDRALAIMGAWQQVPFFLWVHYFDPHAPYTPPREWASVGRYEGEIAYVDAQVRRLLAAVPRSALVVVVADHGEGLGDNGEDTHGNFLYAPTTRVPLIVAGEGVTMGAVARSPVSLVDVAPSILRWCGCSAPASWQGRSLWPLIRGESWDDYPVYFETFHPWHRYGWSPKRGVRWRHVTYLVGDGEMVLGANDQAAAMELKELRAVLAKLCEPESLSLKPMDAREVRFLRSLGYIGEPETHQAKTLALLERGDEALVAGHTSEAASLYSEALALDPGNPHARMASGIAEARGGNLAGAEESFRELVRQRPHDIAAVQNLAVVLFQLGRLGESETLFRRVLDDLPGDVPSREFLAEIRHQAGDYAGSAALYEELCLLRPGRATYHCDAGAVYAYDLGMPREALHHWERALKLDPAGPQSVAVRREIARLREQLAPRG